ncbi:MAG: SDR family oxidoreductase [Pseudomonadota bacterium]
MTQRPVCLITGASAGIGAAVARLGAGTYDYLLVYNSDRSGAETTQTAAAAKGATVHIVQADVGTEAGIATIFAALDRHFGRIDVLVNNAGIVAPAKRLTGIDHARVTQIMNVNVIGAMMTAKEAVTRMEARGAGGVIINVSSVSATLGSPNQYVDYAASKAAIDTFTKGLSDEVAASNIRVMAVRPGLIDTAIHGKGGDPERAFKNAHNVPMQRVGHPEEVAQAILWLASDAASYVTGSTLDVSGGR